jgi:hypothetical protein
MNILVSPTNEAKIECFDLINFLTPYLMLICFLFGIYLFSNSKKNNIKGDNNINTNKIEITIDEKEFFQNDTFFIRG